MLVVLEAKLPKPSKVIPDGATAAVSIDPCTPDTRDVNDSVTIALPKNAERQYWRYAKKYMKKSRKELLAIITAINKKRVFEFSKFCSE